MRVSSLLEQITWRPRCCSDCRHLSISVECASFEVLGAV